MQQSPRPSPSSGNVQKTSDGRNSSKRKASALKQVAVVPPEPRKVKRRRNSDAAIAPDKDHCCGGKGEEHLQEVEVEKVAPLRR